MKKIKIVALILVLLSSLNVNAAKRYWVATAHASWNNTANWSSTSGGAGGSSVPSTNDTAYFNSNGNFNDTFDINVSVKRLEIASTYTAKIVQGSKTLTIGTSGATLSGGTFAGGSANIAFTGTCTISGCAFTSTSGTFTTNSNFTFSSGSFTHNGGSMKFTATATISGSCTMKNLIFNPAGNAAYTIASGTTVTVDSNLYVQGSTIIGINTGTIHVKHDFINSNSNTSGGGTALIVFNGSGTQRYTGSGTAGTGCAPSIQIDKSSGDSLKISNYHKIDGDWTFTNGIVDAGTSIIYFSSSKTITGSHSLYGVIFLGGGNYTYTIASGTTLTTLGTLQIAGTSSVTFNTGTINARGDITISNTGTGAGSATIVINGTGNQTLDGPASDNQGRLPNVQINKSSGTLYLVDHISVTGNWTYTAGSISPGTSTLYFTTSLTITGSHTLKNVTFSGSATSTYTIASGTTLTVDSTLTITGSNVATINTGTINAKGNISHTSNVTSGTAGTYTLVINGTGDQTFTGSTTATAGRINSITINKSSGTLTLANWISVYGNFTYTAGTISPGSSTVNFVVSKNISGNFPLNNVIFNGGYTYSMVSSSTITASGEVKLGGTSPCIVNGAGAMNCQGDLTITNTSTGTVGNQTFVLNGTGNQTFTGSGVAGEGRISNVTIDKSSGTLTLTSVISVTGTWTYIQGSVSPGSSTVAFYGTMNLDGQASGAATMMPFNNVTINGNTRTLTGNLDVNGNLTISSGTTLSAGSNTIYLGGDWNSVGTWTYSTSTVVFDGSNHNKIKGTGTVNFYNVTVNRSYSAGSPKSVKLQNPMQVNNVMILQKGRVITDATNYLAFPDNAVATVFNDDSAYVCGPIRKTGNDWFKFPLGDTLLHDSIAYHPLDISAPSSTSDRFEASYHASTQPLGGTLVDTIESISSCEHWTLDRQVGSSNVKATLGWNENCVPSNFADRTVAVWDGSKWIDAGVGSSMLIWPTGTITSDQNVTFVSNSATLVIGVKKAPYRGYVILKHEMDGNYHQTSSNSLWFRFEQEYYNSSSQLTFTIRSVSSNSMVSLLGTANNNQLPVYGDNRYRFDLYTSSGALSSGYYVLEVTNEKSEKQYLRFKI